MFPRHFTVEEATEYLPWLRRKFETLVFLYNEITKSQETINELNLMMRSNGTSLEEKLTEKYGHTPELTKSLQESLDEVVREEIIVRDIEAGLVDFPFLRDGEEVFLCWTLAEDQISYWHPTNQGYSSRQSL
ncbi:MAG: DUF2203 family protein [SAR202 cluster bacterium]|nr:DUF2203 family protein [SAR202 cluster bacterium]